MSRIWENIKIFLDEEFNALQIKEQLDFEVQDLQ